MQVYFCARNSARFWSYVKDREPDQCWLWQGGTTTKGYGLVHVAGRMRCAHRYAKEMELGEQMPRHLDASHLCHVRLCVNPAHIVFESRKANMARGVFCGARNGRATISEATARAVLAAEGRTGAIALALGVTRNIVYQIRGGRSWRHLSGLAPLKKTAPPNISTGPSISN